METLARPHQGRILFGLGLLAFAATMGAFPLRWFQGWGITSIVAAMVALPLGVWVWHRSAKELARMEAGVVDPSGRDHARLARVLVILSTLAWLTVGALAAVTFLRDGLRLQPVR